MTESDKRSKKILWFGYGNYGSSPILQIGGGYIRDPNLFERLLEAPKTEDSPITYFICAAAALIGLMAVVALFAWGISLIFR